MDTTRQTSAPGTAPVVRFSVPRARIGEKSGRRAGRRSYLQALLWASWGRFGALRVCRRCWEDSWWRKATLWRLGESPAGQSLPSPRLLSGGDHHPNLSKQNKYLELAVLFYRLCYRERERQKERDGEREIPKVSRDRRVNLPLDCNDIKHVPRS